MSKGTVRTPRVREAFVCLPFKHGAWRSWPAAPVVGVLLLAFIVFRVATVPDDVKMPAKARLDGQSRWEPVGPDIVADASRCFLGQFYEGLAFEKELLQRRDCQILFDWGDRSPQGVPSDAFSVQWRGVLHPPTTGIYVFYVGSDDGSRLVLNGEVIIDRWLDQAFNETVSDPVQLNAEAAYPIILEYFENKGGARVQLLWSKGAQEKQPLTGRHVTVD